MTSHRCGQAIAAARRVREVLLRGRTVLIVAALVLGFGTTQFATAFLQVPDEPSPASGTAQVVAQGVVDIPNGDVRWQITEQSAPPPANATESRSDLGFLIVDSGVLLAEDVATGEQHRLPPGEAMLTLSGAEQMRVALGSDAGRLSQSLPRRCGQTPLLLTTVCSSPASRFQVLVRGMTWISSATHSVLTGR